MLDSHKFLYLCVNDSKLKNKINDNEGLYFVTLTTSSKLNLLNNFQNVTFLGNFCLEIQKQRELADFEREIIPFENHFWDFYNKLEPKVKSKFDWTISLIERTKIVPKQYFERIIGTDGLWEIRVKTGNNIFRVFCFFDKGNVILLLNGFQK